MNPAELDLGAVYPTLDRLRDVSIAIAVAVSENMFHSGRATKPLPLCSGDRGREGDRELLATCCREAMYTPVYEEEYDRGDGTMPVHIRSRL